VPINQIVTRGFAAGSSVLVGVFLLFLLHAPVQVLNAVAHHVQWEALPGPGQAPDLGLLTLGVSLSFAALALALGVFFLFPLVMGGILGQVRDRLESPQQARTGFGTYGRAFYVRLLGNLGIFALVMIVVLSPVMCLAVGLAFQDISEVERLGGPVTTAEGKPVPEPPDPQQLTRYVLLRPVMLAGIAIASFLVSAASMVYWVACCRVVCEGDGVFASWGKALRFCRANLPAVFVVLLLSFAVGFLISALGILGQLGIVKDMWALVVLAVVYSAFIACWGVLLAGAVMSLYLARRPPLPGQLEPGLSAVA
jgi:hypothetical protein